VIGVFRSVESWVRLETCYLIEYSEDWRSDRTYLKTGKGPGSHGAQPESPNSSGRELKRVTMAPKLRTSVGTTHDPVTKYIE